jgi:hypothetical protein
MPKQSSPLSHPQWCVQRYCRGVQHVSARFVVEGDVPLVVELYQPVTEPEPLLSILERDGSGFVTVAAAQARDLANILLSVEPDAPQAGPVAA